MENDVVDAELLIEAGNVVGLSPSLDPNGPMTAKELLFGLCQCVTAQEQSRDSDYERFRQLNALASVYAMLLTRIVYGSPACAKIGLNFTFGKQESDLQTFAEKITQVLGLMEKTGEFDEREKLFQASPSLPELARQTARPLSVVEAEYYFEAGQISERFRDAYEVAQPPKRMVMPPNLPQQTWQEIRAVQSALADGPSLKRWSHVTGEVALSHKTSPDARLQTHLGGGLALSFWGRPETVDALQAELSLIGPDAALISNLLTGLALTTPGNVTLGIDDLISMIGKGDEARRNQRQRAQIAETVWRAVLVIDSSAVVGDRGGSYRNFDKQRIDLGVGLESIIRITAIYPGQLSTDGSTPPAAFSYVCGPWIEAQRNNQQVLTHFGSILKIARIPGGKPSGSWARSVGMGLNQRWREKSARATIKSVGDSHKQTVVYGTFTRRDLLLGETLFRAQKPDPETVLTAKNPGRAREYWEEAIGILKSEGLIGYYKEAARDLPSRNWQADWLGQPLDIRPAAEAMRATREIAEAAKAARRRGVSRKAN